MSFSTALENELAQRKSPSHEVFSELRNYPARQSAGSEITMSSYRASRQPLNHPATEQLHGKSVAQQVRIIMADRCRFLCEFPPRRVMDDRCDRVVGIYSELKSLKFDLGVVTSFGLKHAMALLESWKKRDLARKTIYNRWSTLRTWALTINKHGMLGPLEEHWPEFEQACKPTIGYRILTSEQLLDRTDFLREQKDKTAYFVDRLTREVGMSREQALELSRDAVEGVVQGDDIVRIGNGASVHVFKQMGRHRELMIETSEFMSGRHREKLCWTGLTLKEGIAKFSVRMSYVTRSRFPDAPKVVAQESAA